MFKVTFERTKLSLFEYVKGVLGAVDNIRLKNIELTWTTQISFGSTLIFPNSVVITIWPCWGTRKTKQTHKKQREKENWRRRRTEDWAVIVLVIDDSENINIYFLTNQKVSIWVVEAARTRKKDELWWLSECNHRFSFACWCEKLHFVYDGKRLHMRTHSPVKHGAVAGVHVDGNTVARFGIPSTTDGLKTLQHANTKEQKETIPINQPFHQKLTWHPWVRLTATKSTFFSVVLGIVNGSHRSCERNTSKKCTSVALVQKELSYFLLGLEIPGWGQAPPHSSSLLDSHMVQG